MNLKKPWNCLWLETLTKVFFKSKNKLDFIRIYTDAKNQFLKGKYFIKNVGPKIHKAIRFSKYIWDNTKLSVMLELMFINGGPIKYNVYKTTVAIILYWPRRIYFWQRIKLLINEAVPWSLQAI